MLERVVGDLELPAEIVVVAAANPPELAADGWDLSPPLANRFCHLDWPVEARVFATGLTAGWPAPVAPALPAGWESRLALSRGLVAAFVSVRPGLAVAMPEDRSAAGRGWPSPRSWEMTALLWTAASVAGASERARAALVMGAVGRGAGLELLNWIDEMDLPDPEEVLADPRAFVMPERGDRAYAALSAVAAAVARTPPRSAGSQAGRCSPRPPTAPPTSRR